MLMLLLACCAAAATRASLVSDLQGAAALFEDGLLTAAEYAAAKRRLLAPPSGAALAATAAAVPTAPPTLNTFGTGWSASVFNGTETTIFEHAVPSGTVGVMTHFWITGMEQAVHRPGSFFNSNGTDNATVRNYIDGEATASIAFKPPMAAGVGFSDSSANGDPTGMAHRLIGRAGMGGWYMNLKIPFGVSVRVTLTKDGPPGPYGWKQVRLYIDLRPFFDWFATVLRLIWSVLTQDPSFVIVRGCENLPVMVGAQMLPPSARLRLHKIEGRVFQPLDWVPLLDM